MYLVHRITFSPLAVREMFFAQTGRSEGGLGREGGPEEVVQRDSDIEEKEVMEVEVVMGEVVRSGSSSLLLFFFSSMSSSSSQSSSSSFFSSLSRKEPSHDALLCSIDTNSNITNKRICMMATVQVILIRTWLWTVPLQVQVFVTWFIMS